MEDKSREGTVWAIITLIAGIIAVVSKRPEPKLVASSIAVGAGTIAVDCFTSTARASYQQLAASAEYPQLPSDAHWVRVSANPSGSSQQIHPTLIAKRVGKLDLLRDSN